MTLHESFASSFDPIVPPGQHTTPLGTADITMRPLNPFPPGESAYGFGHSSVRFHSAAFPSAHVPYGYSNTAVIGLQRPTPAPVDAAHESAPSRVLPAYAANFVTEDGRAYAKTVSRSAPASGDGAARYWVQAKDLQSPLGPTEPPEIFPMAAPRGAWDMQGQGGPATVKEDEFKMTPAERREAVIFNKAHDRARKALRKANNDACRLTSLMQQAYPNGALGLESSATGDSIVYRMQRARHEAADAAAAAHARARHENLRAKRDTQLAYPMLDHDPANTTTERLFQGKARTGAARDQTRPSENHFVVGPAGAPKHAYRSNQEQPLRPPNSRRADAIVNASTGGRDYNIISGVPLAAKPTAAPPSGIDRRAHPSNLSLPLRAGTAPTLVGPIPNAHTQHWQPASPQKSPSKRYMC